MHNSRTQRFLPRTLFVEEATSLDAKKQFAPWIKTTTKKHFLLLGGKDDKLQTVPFSELKFKNTEY